MSGVKKSESWYLEYHTNKIPITANPKMIKRRPLEPLTGLESIKPNEFSLN